MSKSLLLFTFIAFSLHTHAQNFDSKLSIAVQKVYSEYKMYFDSNLLSKHVVLDKEKSFLFNSRSLKLKTLSKQDLGSFEFDEFSLTFAILYKGDTIRRLPACRLDTLQNLMALGTPSNPVHHGDVLPPYLDLVKGKITFDYQKLQKMLRKMKLGITSIDLKSLPDAGNKEFVWQVTAHCPDARCRQLQISAINGKILADTNPE